MVISLLDQKFFILGGKHPQGLLHSIKLGFNKVNLLILIFLRFSG